MKLNELYSKSLKEVVESMEMQDLKVHTDDEGNIKSIELKYGEADTQENKNTTGGKIQAPNKWKY